MYALSTNTARFGIRGCQAADHSAANPNPNHHQAALFLSSPGVGHGRLRLGPGGPVDGPADGVGGGDLWVLSFVAAALMRAQLPPILNFCSTLALRCLVFSTTIPLKLEVLLPDENRDARGDRACVMNELNLLAEARLGRPLGGEAA